MSTGSPNPRRTGGPIRPARHRRLSRLAAACTTMALLLAGVACRGGEPSTASGGEDPYSDAAIQYGMAPAPDPDVVLQPDVVIVGDGGRSIRSVTADGLTWRIDGRARRADELAVGKIMFVTGRAIGRVLHLGRSGSDLLVTVGPVDLTEVIRDATLSAKGVALKDPIVYSAGDPIWAETAAEPGGGSGGSGGGSGGVASENPDLVRPVALAAPTDRPQAPPATRGDVTRKPESKQVYGICCDGEAGVHFGYRRNGARVFGEVSVTFDTPQADVYLEIVGGSVKRAEMKISAGFGLKVRFEAGTETGENVSPVFPIGQEFSIPVPISGLPLALTISQTLAIKTAFGGKVGTINGGGEYSIAGSIGYGYHRPYWGPVVEKNFKLKNSLGDSLTGIPVGVMGLLIEHSAKFTLGFNTFVLKAGVFFELVTAYGATLGSALGAPLAVCRGVGLGVRGVYGIGYSILEPVVKLVNELFSLLDVRPIKASGEVSSEFVIHRQEDVKPDVALCGHTPGYRSR
ncbi:hypothetical protein [Plantactinospora sp. GCM10030261]|uniref:hypothetical protein n=1 Tax=Plantactinospora sp. GCM10030261 TaxID=3273420 RepID=UPI00360B28AA